jgi:rhomboid protease GluP
MSTRSCAVCGEEFELPLSNTTATVCPACDEAGWKAGEVALARATANAPTYPVTIGLIALNAFVFVCMVLRGGSPFSPTPLQALAFGADFGPLTLNGQWWRLATSMFVHFGIVHIGLNMWCLWNLGRAAEILLGRFCYLLAYSASGIFGSIAGVYGHPMAVGAGASGAIFGLAGVLFAFVRLKKTPAHLQISKNMVGSIGGFIVYNLVIGAAIPGVSNAAHAGGLVMGLLVGALLPSAAVSESSRRTRLALIALFSAASLFASAAAAKRLRSGVVKPTSSRQTR